MRTNRSAPPPQAAPISAAVTGGARRSPDAGEVDADARALVLRVIALLGIGLVAAAILLPSGEPAVLVPGDRFQPVSATKVAPEDEGDDAEPTAAAPKKSAFAAGSSAASVAGDDLKPRPVDATTPEVDRDGAGPEATAPREKAKPRSSAAKKSARRKTAVRKKAGRKRTAQAPAAEATQSAAPPVAAAPPVPAPAPAPPPRRARGGPKAEFGGL